MGSGVSPVLKSSKNQKSMVDFVTKINLNDEVWEKVEYAICILELE